MSHDLDRLVVKMPPLPHTCACADVYDRLAENEDLLTLAVVQDNRPIGIINRGELLFKLAHNYGRALFSKKPITALMDNTPLIVDVTTALSELNTTIVHERPSALLKGNGSCENGYYLGVGTALSLLTATVEQMEARSAELLGAERRAQAASLAKSQFLASMSHELRTPLNAIIGFSDLMAQQVMGPIDDAYREYATDINGSGQHLLSLVNDILDVTKIEVGRMTLNETVVNLSELVGRCLRMVGAQAKESGIELARRDAPSTILVSADETKLRQVILNLLSNALKFTDAGGTVAISINRGSDCTCVTVADTGIGIPAEHLGRIFRPFEQVDSELNRQYNGAGLGLHLALSLMELHGGTLMVDSKVDVGTDATLRLPASRAIAAAA